LRITTFIEISVRNVVRRSRGAAILETWAPTLGIELFTIRRFRASLRATESLTSKSPAGYSFPVKAIAEPIRESIIE
jgi:hypothetical protein